MQRISTNFLRRDDGISDKLTAIELVRSSHGVFHLFENTFDYTEAKYSKVEMFKNNACDQDDALDVYGDLVFIRVTEGYEPLEDGEDVFGIGQLLNYTENYVDSQKAIEQPLGRDIYPELHRNMVV